MEVTREVRTTKNGTPKYVYLYDGMEFSRKKDAIQVKERDDNAFRHDGNGLDGQGTVECCDAEFLDQPSSNTLQTTFARVSDPLDDARMRGIANYSLSVTSTLNRVFDITDKFLRETDELFEAGEKSAREREKSAREREKSAKREEQKLKVKFDAYKARTTQRPDGLAKHPSRD